MDTYINFVKRTLFISAPLLFTFYFLFFTFARSAYAHILKTDGEIGAVLHIDPEDDPIVGELTGFFFDFKDNKFAQEKCVCTFLVTENGKEIYSQPLSKDSSAFFTFPARDVYKVVVRGRPEMQGAFQPFTLTYDIRVERISSNQNAPVNQNNQSWISTYLLYLITACVVLGFVVIGIQKTKKREVR